VRHRHIAQPQDQRTRTASALDELAQLQLDDIEAGVEQAGREFPADLAGKDRPAQVQRTAGHAGRVRLADRDPPLRRISLLNQRLRGRVKRAGIVQQVAASTVGTGQRRKAGVQVVEARVHQVQRGHRNVPGIGHVAVGRLAGAHAMRCPQGPPGVAEAQVAFALEGGLARRLP
jgi:hypothetical protein